MNRKTKWMMSGALIAALYIVLTQVSGIFGLSSGVIQIRISEALNVFACFTPAAIPGLFVGCFIANILGGAVLWDVVFGSIATLLGVAGVYVFRKQRLAALFCPIISNALIVPFVLKYAYGFNGNIIYFVITVATGEIISCGAAGYLFGLVLDKYKSVIFK